MLFSQDTNKAECSPPALRAMCRFHKIKPVLLCHHWQTFHTEDVLSMAKYQNQFIATSSYNGDIPVLNISTFRPILSFNASPQSPLPLLPKRVWSAETCCPLRVFSAVGQNHVGLGWVREVEGSDGDLF